MNDNLTRLEKKYAAKLGTKRSEFEGASDFLKIGEFTSSYEGEN
jgi:hypothetical protein